MKYELDGWSVVREFFIPPWVRAAISVALWPFNGFICEIALIRAVHPNESSALVSVWMVDRGRR